MWSAGYSPGTTDTTRPARPRLNSTLPAARAYRVSSLPMPTPSPGLNRVPRWRTMISPPVTVWPANTFTPSRLECESRPLREEPRPFLCAITFLRLGLAGSRLARRGLLSRGRLGRGLLSRGLLSRGRLGHGLLGRRLARRWLARCRPPRRRLARRRPPRGGRGRLGLGAGTAPSASAATAPRLRL